MIALANGPAWKPSITPAKRALIVDARERMNAVRLPLRPGIGIGGFALVDVKSIVCAVGRLFLPLQIHQPPSSGPVMEIELSVDFNSNGLRKGSPDLEFVHRSALFLHEQRNGKMAQKN